MSPATVEQILANKMQTLPSLNKYLAPSLANRARSNNWYENRVIRYFLKDSSWISDLEVTFQEAQLDTVHNSDEIFSVFGGHELDYDEQLFDALAEVRLCRWARQNGLGSIKKLPAQSNQPTPDFFIKRNKRVTLAEAKHFRVRDYLVYFIADRLEGLALKTVGLKDFGLQVKTGSSYTLMRKSILRNRKSWIEKTRAEITEAWFTMLEQSFKQNPGAPIEMLHGLFMVESSSTASSARVFPVLTGNINPKATVELCLSKLRGELRNKLQQIRDFMKDTGDKADHAIVFFSGIDEWEPEWSVVWENLDAGGEAAWNQVSAIKGEADQLIDIPFKLIVGRYQKEGGPNGEVQHGPM